MLTCSQLGERTRFRRSSTLKYPGEKAGFLKRAREKVAALNKQAHSRKTSIEMPPGMKVHLTYTIRITQAVGDD